MGPSSVGLRPWTTFVDRSAAQDGGETEEGGAAAEGGSAARVSLCGRLVGGLFVVELEKEMIDGIGSSRTP